MSTSVCAPSLPSSATIPSGHAFYPSPSSTSNRSSVSSSGIIPARRNVSRNLFGSPDRNSAQYAREKVKEIISIDREKWNFDFSKGVPLPGRFQWVPVAVETPESSTSLSSSVSESPLQPNSSSATAKAKIISTSTTTTTTSRTRTPATLIRITEYFPVKKRKSTSTVTSSDEKKAK